jgi:zinc/manganese transport system substrate-binding protein
MSRVGSTGDAVIQVVAAENFWGSLASQVGGVHAHVVSIITNPTTDPHSYEPTSFDARSLAASQLVIENGIGYDPWVSKLVAADDGSSTVMDVGALLHIPTGGNPHRWYNPSDVRAVVDRITADYERLDPSDRSYFEGRHTEFVTVGLKQYNDAIGAIKATYGGTPVGASESIFAMLAPALSLDLITPGSFLRAISEGSDVSTADESTVEAQIKGHLIKIYVFNSQNVTPEVQTQLDQVKAAHIPTADITETLQPTNVTFQTWQTDQLLGIERALARAGRGVAR